MCVCVIFEIEKTENANERINENEGNKISRVKKKKRKIKIKRAGHAFMDAGKSYCALHALKQLLVHPG